MEQFIKNLAKGAGAILREGFKKEYTSRLKSEHRWNLVTNFDLAAEKFIIDKIHRRYPRHGIVAEESGASGNKRQFWVIDPIDGTHAFTRGLAQFSTCIAFVSHRHLQFGVVYDPIADELFFAKLGRGAFRNGEKIQVFPQEELNFATVSLFMGSAKTTIQERSRIFQTVLKYGLWLSRVESAALSGAYVACGRFESLVSKNLSPWDYAAAGLILAEAGARVTDFHGRPFRWNSTSIIAANPVLQRKLLKELRE